MLKFDTVVYINRLCDDAPEVARRIHRMVKEHFDKEFSDLNRQKILREDDILRGIIRHLCELEYRTDPRSLRVKQMYNEELYAQLYMLSEA